MTNFYSPDLGADPENPFARDDTGKLHEGCTGWIWAYVVVLAMTQGVGAPLTADQKRAHLDDIGRRHLIDQVCTQESCRRNKPYSAETSCAACWRWTSTSTSG